MKKKFYAEGCGWIYQAIFVCVFSCCDWCAPMWRWLVRLSSCEFPSIFYSWELVSRLFMLWSGYPTPFRSMCSCLIEPTLQADPSKISDINGLQKKVFLFSYVWIWFYHLSLTVKLEKFSSMMISILKFCSRKSMVTLGLSYWELGMKSGLILHYLRRRTILNVFTILNFAVGKISCE